MRAATGSVGPWQGDDQVWSSSLARASTAHRAIHLDRRSSQYIDLVEVFEDGAMPEARDTRRDEDAEVADMWISQIDDALS